MAKEKKYTLAQLKAAWGAGKHAHEKEVPQTLVGKWFHSFHFVTGMGWQGKILQEVTEGKFLIQLFSWVDGEPTDQKIIPIDEMNNWVFYNNDKDMKQSANEYHGWSG